MVALATVGYHDAQTGPWEVEAVGTLFCGSDFCEDFFARRDCNLRVVVEIDEPVRILEHQHMVVGEVGDVEERFTSGLDAIDCVAVGVARCS